MDFGDSDDDKPAPKKVETKKDNSNPDGIDFPIPGNDDARRSIDLYCNLIKETINSAKKSAPIEDKKTVLKKDEKSKKTIQDLDREKLENKFSKKDNETLN